MLRKTWAIWILIFNLTLVGNYQMFNPYTQKGEILLPVYLIVTIILIWFAYKQIKVIRHEYRALKEYPQAFGDSLTNWDLFVRAVVLEKSDIARKLIPFIENDIKKLKLVKKRAENKSKRIYKRAYKQAQQILYELYELHNWHLYLKEGLSEALNYDATPFTECIQIPVEIKQELIKAKADLQKIADEQILEQAFNLELFTEIDKKLSIYSNLTVKAFEENKKISQARQKIFDQGQTVFNESKLKIKLDGRSLALLEEIITIVAQPIKPSELRRVQYEFDKIMAKISS